MTDKKNEEQNENVMDKRLARRRFLKAGAIAAPVALTLHGGVPLAHADSSGQCAMKLVEIAHNKRHPRSKELQVPVDSLGRIAYRKDFRPHDRKIKLKDYPEGTTLEPFSATPNHWSFVGDKANNRFGLSCAMSVANIDSKKRRWFAKS